MRATRSLLGALALVAVAACGGPQTGAPEFTLPDVRGSQVSLSDYRGQVVLISFWATWCKPCAGELPHLQRIYEAHRDKGFVVLAVSMDGPESLADVGPEVQKMGLTFPVLLDEETRVVGQYNPKRAAPYSILIGRDGTARRQREGYSPGDEVELEREIVALLEEKPAP